MQLGEGTAAPVEAFSSGSLGLDLALGIGGVPRGRIVEIYGPESSGKTTLALHVAAEAQKKNGTVVFIDAEHALDVNYAKRLGVDTSKLLVSQPDCGEQALEICETLIHSNSVDLVVIDSVAALVPRAEIDGEMEDQQPGLQARLMSKALRKLTAIAAKAGTTIIFINQIRMKIGVMFGSPETTAGGNALKFYASVRMDVRRIGQIKDDANSEVRGNRVRVKVVKNKVAPPFREAEFDIIFNEGISKVGEIIDIGVDKGVVDKAGAWFSFKGERLGQGREGSKTFLKEHPEVALEIERLVLSTVGVEVPATSPSTLDESTGVASLVEKSVGKSKDSASGKSPKKKVDLNGLAPAEAM
jgi:recombination protein RecA